MMKFILAVVLIFSCDYASSSPVKRSYTLTSSFSGNIDLCFHCDASCNAIPHFDQWLAYVVGKAEEAFSNSAMMINLSIKSISHVGNMNLASYNTAGSGASTRAIVESINMGYWSTRFPDMMSQGCDAGLILTNDTIIGSIAGSASQASICTTYSHGILKNDGKPLKLAAHLAHEVGHLLFLWHDGATVDQSYSGQAGTAAIYSHCQGNYGCTHTAGCVMTDTITSSGPYPTSFSDCSKAYYDFWANGAYDRDCIVTGDEGSGM